MWKRESNERGFSLVEIITVIIIVGILVSIAVPIYLNQQKSAHLSAVEADISNTLTAMSMQKLDGQFSTTMPTDVFLSDGVTVTIRTATDRMSTCVDGYHESDPSEVRSISSVDKVVKEQSCP